MQILILGAGAIGSLLGARLSTADERIALLTRNRGHVLAIRDKGLVVKEVDGAESVFRLPAFHDPGDIREKADLVIVAVKTYETSQALAGIANCLSPSTLFLTIQNGIGNLEIISQFVPRERVLLGVTSQGATHLGPGVIRHGGKGETFIGEPVGPPSSRVKDIVDLFNRASLPTRSSGEMNRLIWEKLLVNVGINAITALTGALNGEIAVCDAARELSKAAVTEAMKIARARGLPMPGDMPDRVLAVAKATSGNRSSMGQDADKRSPTEIDAINGAIVRLGEELSMETPVNRTLVRLVKTMEYSYGCSLPSKPK